MNYSAHKVFDEKLKLTMCVYVRICNV